MVPLKEAASRGTAYTTMCAVGIHSLHIVGNVGNIAVESRRTSSTPLLQGGQGVQPPTPRRRQVQQVAVIVDEGADVRHTQLVQRNAHERTRQTRNDAQQPGHISAAAAIGGCSVGGGVSPNHELVLLRQQLEVGEDDLRKCEGTKRGVKGENVWMEYHARRMYRHNVRRTL